MKTDGRYTKEEFVRYYRYISACTESDEEFEQLFTSVWKAERLSETIAPPPAPVPTAPISEPVHEQPATVAPAAAESAPTPAPEEEEKAKRPEAPAKASEPPKESEDEE